MRCIYFCYMLYRYSKIGLGGGGVGQVVVCSCGEISIVFLEKWNE